MIKMEVEKQEVLNRLTQKEMNDLKALYDNIQKYMGQTVYRICPKCNENHNKSCKNCAWCGAVSFHGCTVYGLWNDGQYPKEKCQVIEQKLNWNWLPNFIKNLGSKTFFSIEDAQKALE
jgi:GH24 family phage-related lysozyme (muramidase)